ncbi:MAG: NAD(+) synthase, partial [Bdellovibrionales bacterium]|nr:NAD(+) synthase [Bdellovibrionales bacterium]
KPFDTTEENLQARARGTVLMALSNKHGHLVLTTGNKSELAVGYCTLYGDMCGGLAVIADVWKTQVYRLAATLNRERELIPPYTISRPPSAELRPNQTDQDSLPPYETLDPVLRCLIEGELGAEETFDVLARSERPVERELVADLQRRYRLAEYKRRQSAPVIRVSPKAFGSGRRYPITGLF